MQLRRHDRGLQGQVRHRAVNELNPDAGSGDEIEAIKANKDNPGPQAPDVIDVGITVRRLGQGRRAHPAVQGPDLGHHRRSAQGPRRLLVRRLLQHPRPSRSTRPPCRNTPQDWADLLKPEYKNQVALAGDPRASSQAINAVYAAALANGGSLDDAEPRVSTSSSSSTTRATSSRPSPSRGTIDTGATPITIRWAYNALATRTRPPATREIEVTVPKAGRFLGAYVQAISAYAPHPNAAKLWMEYLYSDEGQNIWLKGYCHTDPPRGPQGARRVPRTPIAKLPDIDRRRLPDARSRPPRPATSSPPSGTASSARTSSSRPHAAIARPIVTMPGGHRGTGARHRRAQSAAQAVAGPGSAWSRSSSSAACSSACPWPVPGHRQPVHNETSELTLDNYAGAVRRRRARPPSGTASRSVARRPPSSAAVFGLLLAIGGHPRPPARILRNTA